MPLCREKALITIVDDEPSVRRSLERLVRAEGYDAVSFASGDEFLQSLNGSDTPGCILLDLHMPGLSGLHVLEALAKTKQTIPVIVVTASYDAVTKARVLELGATMCLSKPVDSRVLLDGIRVALQRHAA